MKGVNPRRMPVETAIPANFKRYEECIFIINFQESLNLVGFAGS